MYGVSRQYRLHVGPGLHCRLFRRKYRRLIGEGLVTDTNGGDAACTYIVKPFHGLYPWTRVFTMDERQINSKEDDAMHVFFV